MIKIYLNYIVQFIGYCFSFFEIILKLIYVFRPAIDMPEMMHFPQPIRPEQGISEPTYEEYEQAAVRPKLLELVHQGEW